MSNHQHLAPETPIPQPSTTQTMNAATTPEEQRLMKMYGRMPNRADLLNKKLQDRKYFDSGDYALSQAGRPSTVGSVHPYPDDVPTGPTSSLRHHVLSPSQSPPHNASPPKVVGDPQAYNQHTATTKTPGTVPILSPVRDRSSSLSPADAESANEAVSNYNQKLAARMN